MRISPSFAGDHLLDIPSRMILMIPLLSKLPSCRRVLLRCNLLMVPEMRYKQILLEKRGNMIRTHIWRINTQCKWNLLEAVSRLLYAEAVDGMSAADIAKKFVDQNCLKQGFVKPLEWVVGAIWENARSKYYPAHTREIYICARRQFQCHLNLVWLSTERSGQTGNKR